MAEHPRLAAFDKFIQFLRSQISVLVSVCRTTSRRNIRGSISLLADCVRCASMAWAQDGNNKAFLPSMKAGG